MNTIVAHEPHVWVHIHTVFDQSDTVANIFFIARVCASLTLFESGVY